MIDKKVLVDTLIWITYFRNRQKEIVDRLEALLQADRIVTTDLILAELLRGAKGQAEIHFLGEHFEKIPFLSLEDDFWKRVGLFANHLMKKGVSTPLIDSALATLAIQNNVCLYTLDKNFSRVARVTPLLLY